MSARGQSGRTGVNDGRTGPESTPSMLSWGYCMPLSFFGKGGEVEVVGKVSAAVPRSWERSWNARWIPGFYSLSMTFHGVLRRRIYNRWDQRARRAAQLAVPLLIRGSGLNWTIQRVIPALAKSRKVWQTERGCSSDPLIPAPHDRH